MSGDEDVDKLLAMLAAIAVTVLLRIVFAKWWERLLEPAPERRGFEVIVKEKR